VSSEPLLPVASVRASLRVMIPISVQLYTVRDLLAKDFAGTLKEVARIGYKSVEMAGLGSLTAVEARKALDAAGLTIAGAHARLDLLEGDINKVFADQTTLGNKVIICPWLPPERRNNWKELAGVLNKVGRSCRERGFDFAYHHHSFEYVKVEGGKYALDVLLENSDPELVKLEVDVYWVKHGGDDPVARMTRLGQRVVALHLKDMAAGPDQKFAEVGTGILDFKAILAAAEKTGAKYGAVEQDETYGTPPLDAIRTSFENLKKLGA
jgi:sugar phosphate isomerase/epimerase